MMKAKDYLMQVRFLNRKIRRLQQDIENLKLKSENTGSASMETELVKASKNLESFSKHVVDAVAKEQELRETIQKLDEKKQEVIDVIENVSNPDIYEVLYMHYIQEYKWIEISERLEFSYSWVHELNNKGLDEIQTIVDSSGLDRI
jgi:DNA-directed RNA polymerase specialized sigma24 family protein